MSRDRKVPPAPGGGHGARGLGPGNKAAIRHLDSPRVDQRPGECGRGDRVEPWGEGQGPRGTEGGGGRSAGSAPGTRQRRQADPQEPAWRGLALLPSTSNSRRSPFPVQAGLGETGHEAPFKYLATWRGRWVAAEPKSSLLYPRGSGPSRWHRHPPASRRRVRVSGALVGSVL